MSSESCVSAVDSDVSYVHDAAGNRVRKDVNGSDPTESSTLEDSRSPGHATGVKIAKSQNQEIPKFF